MADSLPTSSTVEQFCKRHNFGRTLFYGLIGTGKGPRIIKVGRRTRITAQDEAEWLDRLRAEADANPGPMGKAGRPRKNGSGK
jgi:hypothetical protein